MQIQKPACQPFAAERRGCSRWRSLPNELSNRLAFICIQICTGLVGARRLMVSVQRGLNGLRHRATRYMSDWAKSRRQGLQSLFQLMLHPPPAPLHGCLSDQQAAADEPPVCDCLGGEMIPVKVRLAWDLNSTWQIATRGWHGVRSYRSTAALP